MAWTGYVAYNGNEIINVKRTEEYAAWAELPWFKPVYENDALSWILGDGARYISPLQDTAPWTDPDLPESYGFYGFYPLDITGLEDSTRTSTVTQNISDGGYVGRLRHGTKSVTFNGVLIAEDDAAADYGFKWLKQALLPGPCGPDQCSTGADLCYLASEPFVQLGATVSTASPSTDADAGGPVDGGSGDPWDGGTAGSGGGTDMDGGGPVPPTLVGNIPIEAGSLEDCLPLLLRSLRKSLVNSGPTITSKRETSDSGAVWTVSFTLVAGEPWEYGTEVEVIEGFLDPEVEVPWVGGVVPDGGYIDLDGFIYDETPCLQPVHFPLQDPECPALVPPPLPPTIPLGCYTPPKNWRRRQITIPADYIPLWGEVVPKFQIHARDTDVRNLRLRFYADVDGDGDISDDPCAWCGDIVCSYIPVGNTLVFDTSERSVYVVDASQTRRRAESVVFSTDGTPFDWPILSCGFGYVVTLDLPQTQHPPVFDLSLYSRIA